MLFSSGKEEATGARNLLAQFRQKEKESSGKDAADNLSESSMLTSSSGPTAQANQRQFAEIAQSYASEDAPGVFDDMVQSTVTINAADKKKSTDDESRRLSRLLHAPMRFHVRKQREILELEEQKKKSNQELEEQKKRFAECDEELKKQRRQVRVLTTAVDRERDYADELRSRLHKPASGTDDTASEDTALEKANAWVAELATRLHELESSSSGTRPNTTASEDTASTRSSPLQRKHTESLERIAALKKQLDTATSVPIVRDKILKSFSSR